MLRLYKQTLDPLLENRLVYKAPRTKMSPEKKKFVAREDRAHEKMWREISEDPWGEKDIKALKEEVNANKKAIDESRKGQKELSEEVDTTRNILGVKKDVMNDVTGMVDRSDKRIDRIIRSTAKILKEYEDKLETEAKKPKGSRKWGRFPTKRMVDNLIKEFNIDTSGTSQKEAVIALQMFAYGIDQYDPRNKKMSGKWGPKDTRAFLSKMNRLNDATVSTVVVSKPGEMDVATVGNTREKRKALYVEYVEDRREETNPDEQIKLLKKIKNPKDRQRAIKNYKAVLKKDPKRLNALRMKGRPEYEEVKDRLMKDANYHERRIRAIIKKAVLDVNDDDLKKIDAYRKSLKGNPDYIQAFNQALQKMDLSLDASPERLS